MNLLSQPAELESVTFKNAKFTVGCLQLHPLTSLPARELWGLRLLLSWLNSGDVPSTGASSWPREQPWRVAAPGCSLQALPRPEQLHIPARQRLGRLESPAGTWTCPARLWLQRVAKVTLPRAARQGRGSQWHQGDQRVSATSVTSVASEQVTLDRIRSGSEDIPSGECTAKFYQ